MLGTQDPQLQSGHQPVMLQEALTGLALTPGGHYLDATFGGGGHTRAILRTSAPDGRVLAIDADPEAIARAEKLTAEPEIGNRLQIVHANFAELKWVLSEQPTDKLDGALFDLGLSSFQLDTPQRGFAFRFDAPLDMRFDPTQGLSAADFLATIEQRDLIRLLQTYGEEPRARAIARAIVSARANQPVTTTTQLAEIVSKAVGGRRGAAIHPATRTFQALRIAVNDELSALQQALQAVVPRLNPGGRLVVISFHSLEDRIVKRFIQAESATCICPPEQPICTCDQHPRLSPIGRAIRAGESEIQRNPRARSAILRVAEKVSIGSTGSPQKGSKAP